MHSNVKALSRRIALFIAILPFQLAPSLHAWAEENFAPRDSLLKAIQVIQESDSSSSANTQMALKIIRNPAADEAVLLQTVTLLQAHFIPIAEWAQVMDAIRQSPAATLQSDLKILSILTHYLGATRIVGADQLLLTLAKNPRSPEVLSELPFAAIRTSSSGEAIQQIIESCLASPLLTDQALAHAAYAVVDPRYPSPIEALKLIARHPQARDQAQASVARNIQRIEIPAETSASILAEIIYSPHRTGNSLCACIDTLTKKNPSRPETPALIQTAVQMPEADSNMVSCALKSLTTSGVSYTISKQLIGSSHLEPSELPSIRSTIQSSQRLTNEQKSELILKIELRMTLGLEGMEQLGILEDSTQSLPATKGQVSQQLEKFQQMQSASATTDQAPESTRTQKGN